MHKYILKVKLIYIYNRVYKMNESEDFIISMYEADIYNDLLDYMEYKKDSELLINLDATKISEFFLQFITFKIPQRDEFIEDDTDYEYIY